MPRNDRIDRLSVRNVNLTATQISNTQRHNKREKETYVNPDIVPKKTEFTKQITLSSLQKEKTTQMQINAYPCTSP